MARDSSGKYYLSKVISKNGSILQVRMEGWGDDWDKTVNAKTEFVRLAKARSISRKVEDSSRKWGVGDYVDLFPSLKHGQWVVAEIVAKDAQSGQVQLSFEKNSESCWYWSHLDNIEELAAFGTHTSSSALPKMEPSSSDKSEHKFEQISQGLKSIGLPGTCLDVFVQHDIHDDLLLRITEKHLMEITELTEEQRIKILMWLYQYQCKYRRPNCCVHCLVNPADVIFVPCGHIPLCLICLAKLRNADSCVSCSAKFTSIIKLHHKEQ
ncbi:zinc finger (C3HC4-type RING finger) family protein / ankyrin repeat family protein [Reticulomyxa filosa]|uniref:Zinc finger (C3HC4-type RING finger) family protein / ankyrin repeat family protein n=1 Tax=Reticulomyxa filosa TaxID=46433 RepID=X6N810_RETFI|nr:zinc finger (C3HC4-type RING finger) family protein / ankyrin repeat family protein [Reticulomyxa filosa]|eukprot:ETO22400.1 zinc finger (C3HC4-type RING finger) family protein / ankyrin repeat family protein [Reticulomyxa filosa]